ncbi:RES family NAD+ phosphorylase [Cupriavidus sp. CuC1]|uniref:RES family NAD+ phosphorylase n=1 Tax=Cupriavidus sp. CuC1 TaxID=3373131 RepID=UPI0037D7B155
MRLGFEPFPPLRRAGRSIGSGEHASVILKYLHGLIAQPARSEESDYILTQAMAPFLHFEIDEGFDGIIFKSVQPESGFNYAIFPEPGAQAAGFSLRLAGPPAFCTVSKVVLQGCRQPKPSAVEPNSCAQCGCRSD